jgi:hypothetical protein
MRDIRPLAGRAAAWLRCHPWTASYLVALAAVVSVSALIEYGALRAG